MANCHGKLILLFLLASPACLAAGGSCPSGNVFPQETASGGLTYVSAATLGLTSCYYVAASGSDTAAGTSESVPWQHAPGMVACASNCAITPAGGEGFILRGGDTWHFSATTSNSTNAPMGVGGWGINASGTSSNPIFVGVDKTWYSGASWARPVLTMDNPLYSGSDPASCTYNDVDNTMLSTNQSYIDVDNLEFTGMCWSGPPPANDATYFFRDAGAGSRHVVITNSYFHGWTHTGFGVAGCNGGTTYCDTAISIAGTNAGGQSDGNDVINNVVDGSDTDLYSSAAIAFDCGSVTSQNYIRYASNAIVCDHFNSIHDNYLLNIRLSATDGNGDWDGASHGNIIEENNNTDTGARYVYNNVMAYFNAGQAVSLNASSAGVYVFNNTIYGLAVCGTCAGSDEFLFYGDGEASQNAYIANNTFVTPFSFNSENNLPQPAMTGNAYLYNNHFIGSASLPFSQGTGASITISETSDLYQTLASANSQGYTSSGTSTCANDTTPCAPMSGTGSSVGFGTNETSLCTSWSATALCSETTAAVSLGSGNVATYPVQTPSARPSSGAWDAGAYEYSSTPVVANPSCTPGSGAYTSPQTITCTDGTSGATICYRTDGTAPSATTAGTCDAGSTTYSSAFSLTIVGTTYVKALGTLSGDTNSSVVTNTYTLLSPASVAPAITMFARKQ